MLRSTRGWIGLVLFVAMASLAVADEPVAQSPYQRGSRGQRGGGGVYKATITPHWFAGNMRFWYRNDLRGGKKEFVLVDAEKGIRAAAFDHDKLAASLSKATTKEYRGDRLPMQEIEFIDDGKAVRVTIEGASWKCDLTTYECTPVEKSAAPDKPAAPEEKPASEAVEKIAQLESPWPDGNPYASPAIADAPAPILLAQRGQPGRRGSDRSPDGKWTALVRENNVFIRATEGEKEHQLTTNGRAGFAYGMLEWSPDSQRLVAWRIEPGENKEVFLLESTPAAGGRAVLHRRPYPLPGDKFTIHEPHLFNVGEQKEIELKLDPVDFGSPRLRWKRDGHTFTYQKHDRGHQRFRLIEVDSQTGTTRNLIDEQTKTFIWSAHTEDVRVNMLTWLRDGEDEIIYVSEKDGNRHLYLVDVKTAEMKPITSGEFVIRGVEQIDTDKRQIWFRASGKNADQDPYLIHFYRINFDGSGLTALTESNGNHSITYSPDRKYIVDSYNRVDLPSHTELRRVEDGKLVCKLEEADISEVQERGFTPPEVFSAKGRDGKTDIWGIICRPRGFDANKKYPVIEYIYAGPQGSFVPKTFSTASRFASLTDLGFIVVQIDGMGTANRSKAFHDVCWHNLKDAGFPDRILWHKAVAAKYPSYDIDRVGIYGGSAGGQNATAAVLFHGDFYDAAVSGCGCHDNRMDKASWNEQWMGYPVGKQYAESSNIDNAKRLRGKLLLIVGEMDNNVPPESTYRLCDALIKAGKDFDFVLVPGAGHGMGGPYGDRRMRDFFVRNLLGTEPPNRNQ